MRVIAWLLAVTAALPAAAQTPAAPQSDQQPPPKAGPAPSSVDSSRLGVSFDRIKRELAQSRAEDEQIRDGAMKLSFTVQVVGQAPKIDLLQGFSLNGPLNYGGPTHREMLDVVTPQAYKSPAVPLSAIAYSAAKMMWQKSKKERCEEEIRSYKALVMQGVSVPAPSCTQ
jgi:hypothetical protein